VVSSARHGRLAKEALPSARSSSAGSHTRDLGHVIRLRGSFFY
jgi:hypothetical protein